MLISSPQLYIERIVFKGHSSPADFWDDQAQAAWLLRLQGDAELAFEEGTLNLKAGDCLTIAAKHRLKWT